MYISGTLYPNSGYIYEPWWNINDERQAIARCLWTGQGKKVHCWILGDYESSTDVLIRECSASKATVNGAIAAELCRTDDLRATIPKQSMH